MATALLTPLPLKNIRIDDAFWNPRLTTNRRVTLPYEYRLCKSTGRIDAMSLQPKSVTPHQFYDSDVAKWIEAAAYSLATYPDKALEAKVDSYIDLMEQAQAPDGYLNSYYQAIAPEKRWSNVREMHELYCAGHLIEAAVAYYQTTGKRKMLDVMCRYADHINRTFGAEPGKLRGYPGHEEIELALVKLFRVTGNQTYLDLAAYFINERGATPHYFIKEAIHRGEATDGSRWNYPNAFQYFQAHRPVREQDSAVGHAVRAVYLYAGMADVAAETADQSLCAACRKLWRSTVEKRMYITGGIGSVPNGERFSFDYDLPNETAYAETCAAIGLIFFASRMLNMERDCQYADVMERALYNGALSGVGLDGKHFFYANPLTVYPEAKRGADPQLAATRQKWFECSCCPPNIARLLASLGSYVYSTDESAIYTHLYMGGVSKITMHDRPVTLTQRTEYPWDETVTLSVDPQQPLAFTLALRLPGWCRKPRLVVNGKRVQTAQIMKKGYACIARTWHPGDQVTLTLPMPVERVYSHPAVRMNLGKVALMRGPLVYCLEAVDNGPGLAGISLPTTSTLIAKKSPLLGGCVVITAKAHKTAAKVGEGPLYRTARTAPRPASVTAIPYFLWNNRKPGEMLVWIREE